MALPPIIVELKAITSEFKTSIAEAKAETASLEEEGSKNMSGLSSKAKIAAAGIAVGFAGAAVVSVKAAMEYQSSLATVQGAAGLTTSQVNKIGDAFVGTMGKSTFSAQEMSAAFGPVAGVVKEVSGGTLTAASSMQFMKAAMDASEATGNSLTNTTQDLSQVLLAYGLTTKDAGEASNELFNISRNTGVGLDTLATVVDKLHGRLGIAAPTLADTGALMIDLGQHGISGSRGVMVAQTALQSLLGGSKATNGELKSLGVQVFDSSGKFVGMQSVLTQLTPKLAGMSQAQRQAAESVLFGKSAGMALNTTLLAGAGALDKAKAATEAKDAVDKAATAQANTLHGQIHMIAATAEDLAVKFGMVLIPVIQKVIAVVSDTVGWFSKHQTVAKALGITIGAVAGAFVVFTAATKVATAVQAAWTVASRLFTTTLGEQAVATQAVTVAQTELDAAFDANPIGAIVLAIAALAVGFVEAYKHCKPFRDIVDEVGRALKLVWNDVLKPVVDFFENHWKAALEIAVAVFLPFIALPMVIIQHWGQIASFFTGLWNDVVSIFDSIKDAIMSVVDGILNFVTDHWRLLVAIFLGPLGVLIDVVTKHWDQIKQIISAALTFIENVVSTVMTAISAVWNAVWGVIKTAVTIVWDAIKAQITLEINAVKDVIAAVTGAIKTAWDAVWGAIKATLSAVWGWIKPFVDAEINGTKAVITGALDVLRAVWSTTWDAIKSVTSTVWAGLKQIFGWIKTLAIDPLMFAIDAFATAWSTVWDGVKSVVQDAWNFIKPIVDGIKRAIDDTVGAVGKVVGGIGGAIGKVGSFLGLDSGGTVPGSVGKAVPAIVHGGEYMLSNEMLNGSQAVDPGVMGRIIANQAKNGAPGVAGTSSGGGSTAVSTPAGVGGLTVMQPVNVSVTGADAADPNAIAQQMQAALAQHNTDLVRVLTAARGR